MELQQEAQEEHFRQHKNYFQHFLDAEDGNYAGKIRSLLSTKSPRLLINLNDLRTYDNAFSDQAQENIVQRLLRTPMEYIPPLEEAVKDMVFNFDSMYGGGKKQTTTTTAKTEFVVGFEGDFGSHSINPRGLLAHLLCQMVAVNGIVTKVSAVRPKVVKSVHFCPATNQMLTREYRDNTALSGTATSSVYPTKDELGNLLETEYGLCQYKDYQVLSIQETPETAPLGQLPRSCDVIVESDLVDMAKPGDRLRVIGVYRALSASASASKNTNGLFRTLVLANHVEVIGGKCENMQMNAEDLVNVRAFANEKNAFEIAAQSVAPSIFGHDEIKQALLLQLLRGCEKNLANGTHLRGDINILMVGDPSTAKSQLLRFVRSIAPLAVNTTGRGSSGVGLTAAVTRDSETGEKRLEAGAMVLADRGIVCIDEFDKMGEADRVAIHEVMEQQTVTIAKAGIHATLNARCSVLAAANPVYGQYNKAKRPQENIGLPDSLLSRFDLLFVVLDKLDRTVDRSISDHVIRMHRYVKPGQEGIPLSLQISSTNSVQLNDDHDEEQEQHQMTSQQKKNKIYQKYNPLLHGANITTQKFLKTDFLKKFIYYAKTRFEPVLTDEAIEIISEGYAELRSQQTNRTLPVTPRTLETLIRLASGHAKARLAKEIRQEDAKKAMSLMNFALYHDAGSMTSTMNVEKQPQDDEAQDVEEETQPIASPSKKRPRPTNSISSGKDLLGSVTSTLHKLSSESSDKILVKDIVAVLKEENSTFKKNEIVKILTKMEVENRIMFIREKDNESVILV